MPPTHHPTIWAAEPHTIAKIEILSGYLNAWFPILGQTRRGQDLLYVDGFAGPGVYSNHRKGSPLAALAAARAALASSSSRWLAGTVHCAFIERNAPRFEHLTAVVQDYQNVAGLQVHLFRSSFVDGLETLRGRLPGAFTRNDPLFVFIDPFGATGAPFRVVRRSSAARAPRS